MIDDNRTDDSDHRPERRPASLGLASLPRYVPGTAPSAPKRNVLVVLAYLLGCLLVVGLLWTAL